MGFDVLIGAKVLSSRDLRASDVGCCACISSCDVMDDDVVRSHVSKASHNSVLNVRYAGL